MRHPVAALLVLAPLLLACGKSEDSTDPRPSAPVPTRVQGLYHASYEGDAALVRDLLASGVPVEGNNPSIGTPLHAAAQSGHDAVIKLLVQGGADTNALCDGETPLMAATTASRVSSVALLLKLGADPNLAKDDSPTPLIQALWDAEPGAKKGEEIVVLLLEGGADPNQRNGKIQTTPLIQAAWGGNVKMVRELLRRGADPNLKDAKGNSVLKSHFPEVVKILQAAGAK
ncbi:ankyrin repeat domain-containing protein [Elusimicrobiota bacterium]